MVSPLISYHLEQRRLGASNNLGILILKPKTPISEALNFHNYCLENKINILEEENVTLSREAIIALYPKIFSFAVDDLKFGVSWKVQTINYLSSGPSTCFLVEGVDLSSKLSDYKYALRNRYEKVTHPKATLSLEDFFEKVIKNIVHVIDEHELQNGLWILFDKA